MDEIVNDESTKKGALTRKMRSFWEMYKQAILKHRTQIELAEDVVDRFLFWIAPSQEGEGAQWREMLYGLLSLHRLGMDCALNNRAANPFGTTVQTSDAPNWNQMIALRVALAVLHCVSPALLELAGGTILSTTSASNNQHKRKSQMVLRLGLEQIKFSLRVYLLASYWYQSLKEHRQKNKLDGPMHIGLVQGGGLYRSDELMGWTMERQMAFCRRSQYEGSRTGRRVAASTDVEESVPPVQILAAEMLRFTRPLYWASAEYWNFQRSEPRAGADVYSPSLIKGWLTSFAMELTAMLLTYRCRRSANLITREEWKRRRFRLFLFLLRSPLWDRATKPTVDLASTAVGKIPLLGGYLESCLTEYMLYLKHPFVSEED